MMVTTKKKRNRKLKQRRKIKLRQVQYFEGGQERSLWEGDIERG